MSEKGVEFLYDQLQKMINYAKEEFDITYGEVIQVLEMQKLQLFSDSQSINREDETCEDSDT